MNDPNRNTSDEVLGRLKEASYERLRVNLFEAVKKLLEDHSMTWDDLAEQIKFVGVPLNGKEIKQCVGDGDISIAFLNNIAHCFSAEVTFIFRPRFPFVGT